MTTRWSDGLGPRAGALPQWSGAARERVSSPVRTTLLPLLLLCVSPPIVVLLWVACSRYGGSLTAALAAAAQGDALRWVPRPSWQAAAALVGFALFEAMLLAVLPGPVYEGPRTPAGARPRYRLNGVLAWGGTHAVFLAASVGLHLFSPAVVYDWFGELLVTACLGAFLLCIALCVRGTLAPSSPDAGATGNPVLDFFWGVELHPKVGSLELKQLINCRIGMMGWSLTVISFAAKQATDLGHVSGALLVSVALQVAYVFKFFVWEKGYFGSLDITHDRFGYYIGWGVLVWIPGVYTSAAQYLVGHPRELPVTETCALLATGLTALWTNYAADEQRMRVRATDGQTRIWGREPRLIRAEYTTADGARHTSLLLASGFWGLARHFHYVPEILLALAWSLPAGFGHALPYFYVVFLTILLVDRAGRDDRRCARKYGSAWTLYRELVPWRIVPGVF